MKVILLLFVVATAAIGCSGSSSTDAPSDSAASGPHDTSSSSETSSDAHIDTNSPDSSSADAPPIDTGGAGDAGDTGDAGDPLAPHPPAGATKCGDGTFTAGDASTACTKPSFALDDMLLPDGGHGSTPRACGALTTAGGVWQVWCSPEATYVWARFDDVQNDGALTDCHGASLLMIDEGVYDTGSSGGNGAHVSTYQDPYGMIIGTPPGVSQTAIYELTLDGKWPTGDGGASLYVLGNLDDSCAGGPEPPTVLTGVGVTWKAP